jgi:hypothetical protein
VANATDCGNSPESAVSIFYPSASHPTLVCYTDVRCPRVVIIPFISQPWQDLNGNSQQVTVTNFGCFYITQASGTPGNYTVSGVFLPRCDNFDLSAQYGAPLTGGGLAGVSTQVFLWR